MYLPEPGKAKVCSVVALDPSGADIIEKKDDREGGAGFVSGTILVPEPIAHLMRALPRKETYNGN